MRGRRCVCVCVHSINIIYYYYYCCMRSVCVCVLCVYSPPQYTMRDKRECKLSCFYQDECPIRNMAEKDLAIEGTKERKHTQCPQFQRNIYINI